MTVRSRLKEHVILQSVNNVHFRLFAGTYGEMRSVLFRKNLTLAEVFIEISHLIAAEDPIMISFLEDLKVRKRENLIKKLTSTETDNLFDMIDNAMKLDQSKTGT